MAALARAYSVSNWTIPYCPYSKDTSLLSLALQATRHTDNWNQAFVE